MGRSAMTSPRWLIIHNKCKLILFLVFTIHYNANFNSAEPGYFWHITDMHWDPSYKPAAPGVSCGTSAAPPGQPANQFGPYGDYRCDSPWQLINSSVQAMQQIKPDVDFLIWTGDDTPHNTAIPLDDVAVIISNLTDLITYWFPTKQVYPVLGNHDWSPKHQLPPHADEFYDRIADMWIPWIGTSAAVNQTFRQSAGYYSLPITPPTTGAGKLLLVGLNSNLYYTNDIQVFPNNMSDPGGQFAWLDNTLTQAATDQLKVILMGHVPPGQFEKHENTTWYVPQYNRALIDLLRKHGSVISSAFFAHHHSDSFRLVYNQHNTGGATGDPVMSFLIAPAVTPWDTTLQNVMGGAGNNPGVRLVTYDRSDGRVLDIEQYYLNLTQANGEPTAQWQLAYRATDYYGLKDMTSSSLDSLAQRLISDWNTFDKYYKANGLFYPEERRGGNENNWNATTKWQYQVVHYCAITELEIDQFAGCKAMLTSDATAVVMWWASPWAVASVAALVRTALIYGS